MVAKIDEFQYLAFESPNTSSVSFHCQGTSAETYSLSEYLRNGSVYLPDNLYTKQVPLHGPTSPTENDQHPFRGIAVRLDSPTEPVDEDERELGG